jgi:uncharacterized RDD family membrane protein YckC
VNPAAVKPSVGAAGLASVFLSLPPASRIRRISAFSLDYWLLMMAMILIPEKGFGIKSEAAALWCSGVFGVVYLLVKDWIFFGHSIGKLLFRIVVVELNTGRRCGLRASCIRNGVVAGAGVAFGLIIGGAVALAGAFPFITAKIAAVLAIGPLVAVFFYPFEGFGSPNGRTTSDKFGGTYVVNAGVYANALRGIFPPQRTR